MTHSTRCWDPTTYWNQQQCVPCPVKPGYEVTPNCGRDDYGGIHERAFAACRPGTFNDGSGPMCRSCSSCPPGTHTKKTCTTTSDSVCEALRTTTVPVTKPTTVQPTVPTSIKPTTQRLQGPLSTVYVKPNPTHVSTATWLTPVLLMVLFVLLTLLLIFKMRRTRGQCTDKLFKRRRSLKNQGFAPIAFSAGTSDNLEEILNENIMAAPLQTVLDNLDVLEELVILLDPDTRGIKSTKHLASHCSFNSAWITYAYSMKESKSPLRAVLEGVASRSPDWTVGHLAKTLRQMDRNDAVVVLAKLKPGLQQELDV